MTAEHFLRQNSGQANDIYRTDYLLLACFLYAKGVLYIGKEWSGDKAFLIFQKPPDDLLLAWQTAQDTVSARALSDAQNFFRDELRKR